MEGPDIDDPTVRWGVHEDFRMSLPSSLALNFVPLRRGEYLLVALTHICRCERTIVKEEAKIRLTAGVYIPEHDMIIGVSGVTGSFVVMRRTDLAHPVSDDIRTKQVAVFHVLYSPKSSVLITIGQDLRIWNFVCEITDARLMTFEGRIEITQRVRIDLAADMSMINPPAFSYKTEMLYIAGSDGFEKVDLDGRHRGRVTHFQASQRTASAYLDKTESLITADPVDGVCEWNWSGMLVSNHRVTNVSIVAVRFINPEFVFFMDANLNLNILDLMTSRVYAVMRVPEKPVAFVYFENPYPSLAICFGRILIVYKVVTPWKLWMRNVLKPAFLARCNKKNAAARIVIQSVSSFLLLVSPRDAGVISSASPPTAKAIRSFLYDRKKGIDRLFVIQEGGTTVLFSTDRDPCPVVTTLPVQAAAIFEVLFENSKHYCVATTYGELIICDYDNFECKKRILVHPERVFDAVYDGKFHTVLVFFERKVMRFDINKGSLLETCPLEKGSIIKGHSNIVVVCYNNGLMVPITCHQLTMNVHAHGIQAHQDSITGIAFANNFFVTSSFDCSVKIWAYNFTNIASVFLPVPLFAVEILNAKRDLLVGTEQEIMRIPGKFVFGLKFEDEDPSIDNFNKKKDILTSDEKKENRKRTAPPKKKPEEPGLLESIRQGTHKLSPESEDEEVIPKQEEKVVMKSQPVSVPQPKVQDRRKVLEEMLAMTHVVSTKPVTPTIVRRNENIEIVRPSSGRDQFVPKEPPPKSAPTKKRRRREVHHESDAKKILSTMAEKERKGRKKKEKETNNETKVEVEQQKVPEKKREKKYHLRVDLPIESDSSEEDFDFSTDDSGEERLKENEEKLLAMKQRSRRPRPITKSDPETESNQQKLEEEEESESESDHEETSKEPKPHKARKVKRKRMKVDHDSNSDDDCPVTHKLPSPRKHEEEKPSQIKRSIRRKSKPIRNPQNSDVDVNNESSSSSDSELEPSIPCIDDVPKQTEVISIDEPIDNDKDLVVTESVPNQTLVVEMPVNEDTTVTNPRSKSPPPTTPKVRPVIQRQRVRTPPTVREQMKLVLPAPHVVLDKTAVIESYLNGDESLGPLVRQIKKQEIQELMSSMKRKSGTLGHTCPIVLPHLDRGGGSLVTQKSMTMELPRIDVSSIPDFTSTSHPHPSDDEDPSELDANATCVDEEETEPEELNLDDTGGLDVGLVSDIMSTLGKVNSLTRSLSRRRECQVEDSDGFFSTAPVTSMVVEGSSMGEEEFPVREPGRPREISTADVGRRSRRMMGQSWNRGGFVRDRPKSVRFQRTKKPEQSLESSLRSSIIIHRLVRPSSTRAADSARRNRRFH